jgi:hypothetical protein
MIRAPEYMDRWEVRSLDYLLKMDLPGNFIANMFLPGNMKKNPEEKNFPCAGIFI